MVDIMEKEADYSKMKRSVPSQFSCCYYIVDDMQLSLGNDVITQGIDVITVGPSQ